MPMFSGCSLGDDPRMTCSAMCSEWFNEDPAAVDDWSHYNPTNCGVSFIHLLVPYLTIRKSSWCRIFSIVVEKTQLGILNILVNLAHCSRYDTVATKMGSTFPFDPPSLFGPGLGKPGPSVPILSAQINFRDPSGNLTAGRWMKMVHIVRWITYQRYMVNWKTDLV